MSDKLKQLKAEADTLGVKYSPNIGEEKLQSKIEEAYDSQTEDTTSQLLQEAAKAEQVFVGSSNVSTGGKWDANKRRVLAKEREKNARKTKVITIIDNDQRVNNQTDTCTVNCSNEHFDLGQMILPLNTKVEVMQGHIDTLKSIDIINHVKDPVTKMSKHVLRPRYTIAYSEEQPD